VDSVQSPGVKRSSEFEVGIWAAITFGALLASYMAFRPVRDALVLGDWDRLPWLFTATLVVVAILSTVWSAILGRTRPRRAITAAYHAFAGCLLVFAVLVGNDVAPIAVSRVFYVWSAAFNLFVVSVFWGLLADLLGPKSARNLYGPISAGGTIGAIAGPALTKLLVDVIGIKETIAALEKASLPVPKVLASAKPGQRLFTVPAVNIGRFFAA